MPLFRKTIIVGLLCTSLFACSTTPPPEIAAVPLLNDEQKGVLAAWLEKNPNLRLATHKDCDCENDIASMRKSGSWGTPMPDYEPYIFVGDFNGDGKPDFAIMLCDKTKADEGVLVIFNGPYSPDDKPPALIAKSVSLKHTALFVTQKDHHLLIGPFYSEACEFVPKADGYREDCGES